MIIRHHSPHTRPAQRRAALALGAVLLVAVAGLGLLAWFTVGAKHIGALLRLWA